MDDGGLTAGGRFDRIEATLLRIEGKLDQKVDREELGSLISRISTLEAGDTPLGKTMLGQVAEMQRALSELTLHGSQQAKDATSRIGKLEGNVEALEKHRVALNERENTTNQQRSSAFRTWTLVLSALTTFAVLTSTASAAIVLLSAH